MKISIELDDRDWKEVTDAVFSLRASALNKARTTSDDVWRSDWNQYARRLARIKQSIGAQIHAARPTRKELAEGRRAMKADMYGENGNG